MDSVLYSARASKARNHHTPTAVIKKQPVIAIRSAEYIEGYTLQLRFNDGKVQVVDFAPFLSGSTNPLIRQYLELDKFKAFHLTNGDLEWNDYDLCFPIIDLYENKLIHSGETEPKARAHRVNGAHKAKLQRRTPRRSVSKRKA